MERLFRLSLALLLLLLVTASGTLLAAKPGSYSPVLSKVLRHGEIVLGTAGNMPPMTQTGAGGKVEGFDIDLAKLMAHQMNVRLTIKTMPFDKLLSALEKGKVDFVISNVTITQKRNLKVAFVGPYLNSGKCIVTKDETLSKADKSGNIDSPSTRIAVLKGSTSEDFVKVMLPKATIVKVKDHKTGAQMVKRDDATGMLTDYPVCIATVKANPDADFISVISLLSYEPIGIALPPNDPLFINWTENFLDRVKAMGTLKSLSRRWFE